MRMSGGISSNRSSPKMVTLASDVEGIDTVADGCSLPFCSHHRQSQSWCQK